MTVVLTYDIRHDGRRARVAAAVQVWGVRIQKSVYICVIAPADLEQLKTRVDEIIDPTTDSIYVVAQCKQCWDVLALLGQAFPPVTAVCWAVW
nr:CRISPR-associated endonuclease Cas2 [Aeromicrobium duanguangcaii]